MVILYCQHLKMWVLFWNWFDYLILCTINAIFFSLILVEYKWILALWLLVAWCFSTRASVAIVLNIHPYPYVPRCLWVDTVYCSHFFGKCYTWCVSRYLSAMCVVYMACCSTLLSASWLADPYTVSLGPSSYLHTCQSETKRPKIGGWWGHWD